jgi:hypothetical protein
MSTTSAAASAAGQAPNVNQGWSPEPELRDNPPRRIAPSDFPDYNKPNATIFVGVGGALLLVGLILFFVGLLGGKGALFTLLGAVLALGGAALVALYPTRVKSYRDRAEALVSGGVPVMARIVQVQNLTGDSQYGRHITYMITLPGDNEETRREVKGDDRALPKTIPGPATALVDFKSRDVELYAALPFRAVPKFAQAGPVTPVESTPDIPGLGTVPNAGTATGGAMGTIGNVAAPTQGGQKPAAGTDKLPWE